MPRLSVAPARGETPLIVAKEEASSSMTAGWDGMGMGLMGKDGTGWGGMGWDGMGWDGMR